MSRVNSCEIIIYIDDNWHMTRPCIDSVLKNTKNIHYHITLIDDALNPYISNRVKEYSNANSRYVSLLQNEAKIGSTRSINKAIKMTNASFIAIVSNKVVVTSNWLKKMIGCMHHKQNKGICIPVTNKSSKAKISLPQGMDILRVNKLIEISSEKKYPKVPFAEPYAMVFSKNLIDKIGYLDEKFFDFKDATNDFSLRTKNQGFEIVCSEDVFIFSSEKKVLKKKKKSNIPDNNNHTNSKIFNITKKALKGHPKLKKVIKRTYKMFKSPLRSNTENNYSDINNTIIALNNEILNIANHDFSRKYLKPKKSIEKGTSLNILCVLPTLNPYGGVISVVNMLNHLIEMGHNCTLISLSRCNNHPHIFYGEPIYIANWDEIPEKFAGYHDVLIATSWETVDIIAQIKDKSNYGYAYYFVQDLEETFYSEDDIETRQKVMATYNKMDVKFVKSKYLYNEVKKRTENVFKIRPGMNLDLFYPHENKTDKEPVILAMVRFGHYHRGYDLVLETLNKVSLKKPNIKIMLFGSNELDNLSVDFKYVNCGRVKPEELPELYSKADIFLEMSRHHGFGRTGVEAMACGAACVLSNSEGISEYAVDGKNAFIVQVGDTDSAAERICFLIDNPEKRKKMMLEGLKTIKRFSDREAAKDFLKVVYKTHPLSAYLNE